MTCRHPHASEARRELRGTTFARLVSLKQRWHVSIAFLIRQAFDLGLIDDRTRTWFYIQSGQQPGGRRREPAEFAPEEPTLARCLIESLNSDGLSIAEIANVATMDEDKLRLVYLGESPRLRPARDSPPRTVLRLHGPYANGSRLVHSSNLGAAPTRR